MNEDTTTTDDDTFRVWIGCLACYNDGRLTGSWYPASEAGEVTTKDLHAADGIVTDEAGYVRGAEIYGPHEELWVMDLDNAPEGYHREMSPHEAQQIAEAFEEVSNTLDGDEERVAAYFAWVTDHYGQPSTAEIADYLGDFEDRFRGVYDDFRDFADEIADMCLGLEGASYPMSGERWNELMLEVGPALEFAIKHFDYAGHARDLEHSYARYNVGSFRVAVLDL